MKFLVDAQLPRRLVTQLRMAGHDAIHTLDLSQGNRTPDAGINRISMEEQRVVITKDADFQSTFYLRKQPYKLLLVPTGNITNVQLEDLFRPHGAALVTALEQHDFVELDSQTIIIHE